MSKAAQNALKAKTWTEGMLSQFTVKEIEKMAFKSKNTVLPQKLSDYLELHPMGPADITFALEYAQRAKNGQAMQVGMIESFAMSHACDVTFKKAVISVEVDTGELVEIKTATIPTPPAIVAKPYNQPISVAIATMFDVEQGALRHIVSSTDWSKKFNYATSPVRPAAPRSIESTVIEILEKSPRWESVVQNKLTCHGAAFLDLWMGAVGVCEYVDYFALHHIFLSQCVKTFTFGKKNGKVVLDAQVKHMGRPLIDLTKSVAKLPEELKKIGPKMMEGAKKFEIMFDSWPHFWTGNHVGLHSSYTMTGTFNYALSVSRDTTAFRGGQSGIGGLLANLGYAGYSSEEYRSLALQLSMALYHAKAGQKVVFYPKHVGQIPILVQSMKTYVPEAVYKIHVDVADRRSVPKTCIDHVVTHWPGGHHLIWVMQRMSFSEKVGQDIVDKHPHPLESIPQEMKSGYTVFTTIYGPVPFTQSVFQVGLPTDFEGVVSTDPNFTFMGSEDRVNLVSEKMVRIKSERDWYLKVIHANQMALGYWLNPIVPYSAKMNLPTIPRTGERMRYVESAESEFSFGVPNADFSSVDWVEKEEEEKTNDVSKDLKVGEADFGEFGSHDDSEREFVIEKDEFETATDRIGKEELIVDGKDLCVKPKDKEKKVLKHKEKKKDEWVVKEVEKKKVSPPEKEKEGDKEEEAPIVVFDADLSMYQ